MSADHPEKTPACSRINVWYDVVYMCECEGDSFIGMRCDKMNEDARTRWQDYIARLEARVVERAAFT